MIWGTEGEYKGKTVQRWELVPVIHLKKEGVCWKKEVRKDPKEKIKGRMTVSRVC